MLRQWNTFAMILLNSKSSLQTGYQWMPAAQPNGFLSLAPGAPKSLHPEPYADCLMSQTDAQ